MKKSVLFIAAMFLVNMANAQNHQRHHGPKNGNHGNHNQPNYNNGHNFYGQNQNSANTYGCTVHNYRDHNSRHNNSRFISNNEMNGILAAIRNEPFSSDKMNIARQATMYKVLKAHQVVELGRQFSFESDRLEFAKLAFKNTADKENYYTVNSIFHFSSSKRELNRFIYK